jgi:KaiC/GvpD/RAD55 family RecA-like ATPase
MPKDSVERVTTGVPGLDKLISGGLVRGSTTLVTGGAGPGKTILCAQYLWDGLQKGETCLFITLEERPKDIVADVASFGWDFQSYANKGKLMLDYKDPFEVTDIVAPLVDMIKTRRVQRVAIDSTSTLGLYFTNPFEVRKQLFKLLMALKDAGVTALLTAEVADGQTSRFGVEEFITDGLVILRSQAMGKSAVKTLEVRKMRRTKIDGAIHSIEFGKNGISIAD